MDKELYEWFVAEVSEKMAFLTDEYSFAPALHRINARIRFAYTIFVGRNIALEFVLDEREEDFSLQVSKVTSGKIRDDWDWNGRGAKGELVRTDLFGLLAPRAGGASLFTRTDGLTFREQIPIWLADYERMLRKYGQDVLADSPGIF